MKWKDWKFHYAFSRSRASTEPPLMRLFNLRSDPREESDIKDANPWAIGVFDKIVADFKASVERYPNVPANAKDPVHAADGVGARDGSAPLRRFVYVARVVVGGAPPTPLRVVSTTSDVGDSSVSA